MRSTNTQLHMPAGSREILSRLRGRGLLPCRSLTVASSGSVISHLSFIQGRATSEREGKRILRLRPPASDRLPLQIRNCGHLPSVHDLHTVVKSLAQPCLQPVLNNLPYLTDVGTQAQDLASCGRAKWEHGLSTRKLAHSSCHSLQLMCRRQRQPTWRCSNTTVAWANPLMQRGRMDSSDEV